MLSIGDILAINTGDFVEIGVNIEDASYLTGLLGPRCSVNDIDVENTTIISFPDIERLCYAFDTIYDGLFKIKPTDYSIKYEVNTTIRLVIGSECIKCVLKV